MAQARSKSGGATPPKKNDAAGYAYKFKRVRDAGVGRPSGTKSRLERRFLDEIVGKLQEEFKYANPMQVPRVEKIVINIGLGEAIKTPKLLEQGFESLGLITGQRPVVTRAKKSIAGFKLREGMKIGCMVTLRSHQMWEFLDRLLNVALPRTRDFRGLSRKAFEGRGNYTLGVKEILIFPEVDIERLDKVPGMNICIHTSAKTDDESRAMLGHLGMPFRQVSGG